MSYLIPEFRHPDLEVNSRGYSRHDYEGSVSTLCAGCGHDSISTALIKACFELEIEPHRIAKISGIGCSSKTPTYFLGKSHGFNSVHGRMPSVVTGANLADHELICIGVSGDGDTASIGLGQFAHIIRRNPNMLYIVENNGCYGLTKGQDSATADQGSAGKAGLPNPYMPIDLCGMAMQLNCGFVARSFSGDKEQLTPLIKAGIAHKGCAFIDVISPCVTFNNTPQSTKSYDYARARAESTGHLDWVPHQEKIEASYQAGETVDINLHDGSVLRLEKKADIGKTGFDPMDRLQAIRENQEALNERNSLLTGLLYFDPGAPTLHETLNMTLTPLKELSEAELCPGQAALEPLNQNWR